MRLILLLAAAVALMWALRLCSQPGPYANFRPAGGDTIDVAIEYGPMSLYRYDDTLGGFAYDLLRLMSDSSDVAFKFHPVTSYANALPHLAAGNYDLLVAHIPATTATDTTLYAFTVPVMLDRQVLVQRRDSLGKVAIKSQLDLAGHHVSVAAQSPAAARLRNLASEIGDTIYVREDPDYGDEQLVILTATGDIACCVVAESTARSLRDSFPELDISTAISFTQFQAWLTARKNADLRRRIDSLITATKATPAYPSLLHRYRP